MARKPDLIADLVRALAELGDPRLSPDKLLDLEIDWRRRLGGDTLYVARHPAAAKTARIAAALRAGVPMRDVPAATGISRGHTYRLAARKVRR